MEKTIQNIMHKSFSVNFVVFVDIQRGHCIYVIFFVFNSFLMLMIMHHIMRIMLRNNIGYLGASVFSNVEC